MEKGTGDWLWQCAIPEYTELQEHTLKTKRSIIIGDKSRIDYGLCGDEILISEFCQIKGNISAENDIRIDNWSEITGDVTAGGDAYIGEGVKIKGRLNILGDLDLGDNVVIDSGFEAKGWISIRNPLPVITYIMLYLITLLGLEKEEDINSFFQKLFSDDEDEKELPLIIPPNSILNMEVFSVQSVMRIGHNCRLHGNIHADSAVVEKENLIFGSLTAEKDIKICEGTTIHGAVNSGSGNIEVESGVHILGDVRCHTLSLDEESVMDGTIRAPGGVKIVRKK
ncbi:MAG: polymer-forming cytoskeletal protein [Methanomicrobium sp.]|nr:polymer-forming cytoskeletal protein [Methanomicrobium sp.]